MIGVAWCQTRTQILLLPIFVFPALLCFLLQRKTVPGATCLVHRLGCTDGNVGRSPESIVRHASAFRKRGRATMLLYRFGLLLTCRFEVIFRQEQACHVWWVGLHAGEEVCHAAAAKLGAC